MSDTTVAGGSVEVEEMTAEQGREIAERAAQDRFGMSWDAFYAAYRSGAYVGTEQARASEEVAFLAPFAG